jgi:hypothetical protein
MARSSWAMRPPKGAAMGSPVSSMRVMTRAGVSRGSTEIILAARFATLGEAIEVPLSGTRSPFGMRLSTSTP